MELRWILLCVSIIIVALLAWHTSRSSFVLLVNYLKNMLKRENQLDLFADDGLEQAKPEAPQDIVCLHIKAKEGKEFGGEQLLIQLNQAGLRFGEMNIFHYFSAENNEPIFSLASAFEPGTFDMDRMDHFKTNALALFLQTDAVSNAGEALDSLLDVAEELTEKLDADLLDHRWNLLSEDQVDAYYSNL